MGSIKFKYGDLVLIDSGKYLGNSRGIGYVIDPKSGPRSYNGVVLFDSDETWWFKDDEMDLLEPALTANEERAKV